MHQYFLLHFQLLFLCTSSMQHTIHFGLIREHFFHYIYELKINQN